MFIKFVFFPISFFLDIFFQLMLELFALFLVAVISFRVHFLMNSSCFCIDASTLSWMLASPLLPSFLDIYSLSTSSLGCRAVCIMISFLVHYYISWTSFLIHFKNGPKYLIRGDSPDYNYYLWLIRVFHISISWWSFTGDWVKARLLKSPGLFSAFWPFSIIMLFGWSPLGRQLLNLPGPLIIF